MRIIIIQGLFTIKCSTNPIFTVFHTFEEINVNGYGYSSLFDSKTVTVNF